MLKEMIVEKGKKYSRVMIPFAVLLGTLLIAYSTMGNLTAALVCSFAGAMPPLYSAVVFSGTVITYMFGGALGDNGFVICSLFLIIAGKWIMREDDNSKTSVIILLISMIFSSIVFGLLIYSNPLQAVENTLISLVCSAACYFLSEAAGILADFSSIQRLGADKKMLSVLAVNYLVFASVLCGFSVTILNIGIILQCTAILCAGRFFGCYGGVICGVLSTAAVFAGCPELAMQTAFLGIAGLTAGLVSNMSRITIAAVFSGVNLLGQLSVGMNDASFFVQADTVIGGMIFLMLPERIVMAGSRLCASALTDSGEYAGKEMEFAARSLADIRNNINEIITTLSERKRKCSMAEKVCETVCGKCRNKLECWERNYERTNSIFRKIEFRKINENDNIPVGFECIKKNDIAEEFEKCRREEAFGRMLSARLDENRNFLFSQMKASEDIVRSLSKKMNVNISRTMTSTLCRTLEKYGVEYNSAISYYNNEKRLIAEIYVNDEDDADADELCEVLSRELSVKFEYSQPFVCSGETRIRFNQQTKYTLEYSSNQLSAVNGTACGDTGGYFTDGLGYAYIFISDGMGTGNNASVDSGIASGLFKRLVRSGMSCDGAVKMINSVMLAKSDEESFATLDIARINLETGELVLFKSGASSTLIKYDDVVMMYSLSSNPVGIIPNAQAVQKNCIFSSGNILVMMSDGVPEIAYAYIKEQLGLEGSLEKFTKNVCVYSRKITPENQSDDITVTAVKLVERT